MSRPPRHRSRIVLVLALAIAALIAVNCFDEALGWQAQAIFSRPGVAFSRDSGWALMVGLNAPVDQDPRAYAEARHAPRAGRSRPVAAAAIGELGVTGASELFCLPQDIDCTRAFSQRPVSIVELASDNATMLRRYDALLGSRGLADTFEALEYYRGGVAFFNEILRVQAIRLSQIGVEAGAGRTDKALDWLEADATFQRRWLDEAGSMLTKMLAMRSFSRDLLLAGQIARADRRLTQEQWQRLERIAAPLTASQRAVAPVLRVEAWVFSQVLDSFLAEPRETRELIEAPRFMATVAATVRRNATLNFMKPVYLEWFALDEVPTEALAPAIESARAAIARHTTPDASWVYNFFGKRFAADAAPDLADYVYRLRDTDALAALVRCVIALHRTGTAPEAAAALVAGTPSCRNPYGGAFAWDGKGLALSFNPRALGQVSRFGGAGERVIFAAY